MLRTVRIVDSTRTTELRGSAARQVHEIPGYIPVHAQIFHNCSDELVTFELVKDVIPSFLRDFVDTIQAAGNSVRISLRPKVVLAIFVHNLHHRFFIVDGSLDNVNYLGDCILCANRGDMDMRGAAFGKVHVAMSKQICKKVIDCYFPVIVMCIEDGGN